MNEGVPKEILKQWETCSGHKFEPESDLVEICTKCGYRQRRALPFRSLIKNEL